MWKRPTGRFKKHARLTGKLSRKQIARLYAQGVSAAEIAKVDGTTKPSVLNVLKVLGIPRRLARRKKLHGAVAEAKRFGVAYQTYLRFLVIKKFGAACAKCGTGDVRVLAVNHLNGKARKMSGGDLSAIFQGKTVDVDIRCHNCNALYEYERGRFKKHNAVLKHLFC